MFLVNWFLIKKCVIIADHVHCKLDLFKLGQSVLNILLDFGKGKC